MYEGFARVPNSVILNIFVILCFIILLVIAKCIAKLYKYE